ncbi:MAG: NAD(P)H-hydrate dehydratase [Flavobacteriaceae bacterium]|nr:NAD(P)H-hydrate dehydratase [Flavobacteriaceae bacterium]
MKILTAKQIYQLDKATIESQGVTALDLMERAGTTCFEWLHSKLQGNPVKVLVFCGIGNNGGDGLVIARHLHQYGYNVECFIVNFNKKRTEGFLHNYDKLKDVGVWPTVINSKDEFPAFTANDIVIDAILGIGLSRKIKGFTVDLIKYINKVKAYTLAIDIPSGLFADKSFSKNDTALEASHTLTFQRPKIAFLLPENEKYIYTWETINIGLDEQHIAKMDDVKHFMNYKSDVLKLYRPREKFSHKGSFGHSLIIGGSFGKIGAAILASQGALKTGSGKVTAYVPKCGYQILQISIPEVMVEVDAENELQYFNYKSNPTVIGIGCGIGTSEKTKKGFSKFLSTNKLPLALDADALNILSENKELLKLLPENSILTPHPKEFERLVGKWKNDHDKLKKLKDFSSENKIIIVLKGANTVIAKGDKLYFNTTGNPALATAGTGDVLLGIIAGLIAQNYKPLEATILGVYLHGKTATIAMNDMSVETFIASNILDYLDDAYMSLFIDGTPKPAVKKSASQPSEDIDSEEQDV